MRDNDQRCFIPLKNECPVAAADVVCDLGREAFVVHEEKVNFPDVAEQELLQAIRKKVAGLESCQLSLRESQGFSYSHLLVAAVTNLR